MNDDILFNVMLRADYNTLKSLCLTNEKAYEYCHDNYFWHEKLTYDQLPIISVYDGSEWIESYDGLLKAKEEAEILILLTEIEKDDDTLSDKDNFHGEGGINIEFRGEVEDYESIETVIPKEIIQTMLEKYPDENKYDLRPHSIQLYFRDDNTYRLSFDFEPIVGGGNIVSLIIESNLYEFKQILIYFLYASDHYWHKIKFVDENLDNLIYDDARTSTKRKTIIKTIKNIRHKHIKI